MLTVSIPMKWMGFWSLNIYKDIVLPWKIKSSDPIPINGRSCVDCVQNKTAVQDFSCCSQKLQNPKVCFTMEFLFQNVLYSCILFSYKGYIDFFFCCFIISVSYNVSDTMLLLQSNSIRVTILVLEQPYFTFWSLSCCNASSCTYQFESSAAHLCMKIAELIEKSKTWENSSREIERKARMPSGSVLLNLPQPVMFSNLKVA